MTLIIKKKKGKTTKNIVTCYWDNLEIFVRFLDIL